MYKNQTETFFNPFLAIIGVVALTLFLTFANSFTQIEGTPKQIYTAKINQTTQHLTDVIYGDLLDTMDETYKQYKY